MKDKSLLALQHRIPGKRVIDIGCVGMSDKWTKADFIKNLKPNFYLGVDINHDAIKNRLNKTFSIKERYTYCDVIDQDSVWNIAQNYGTFDVIVMYDILEHLDNVGSAVENILNLTNDNTIVLISTPNAICDKWIQHIREGGKAKINTDHVHWFCRQTLYSLFNRYGYTILKRWSNDLEPRLVMEFTKI